MSNNLIDGDMRQLGKMQKFTIEVNVIPDDIKERLVAYLKTRTNEEILTADCQIIIDGWLKIKED